MGSKLRHLRTLAKREELRQIDADLAATAIIRHERDELWYARELKEASERDLARLDELEALMWETIEARRAALPPTTLLDPKRLPWWRRSA